MAYAPIPAKIPADWPMRQYSRTVHVKPHLWHVQVMGQGPALLMLHGAGASTHTWRALAPLLMSDYTLIMPDLPGQGFTRLGNRSRSSLDLMAADIATLLADQGWQPAALIGHSAGAALALRLSEILPEKPRAVIGLNAALGNFDGVAGFLFPVFARLLALNPLIPTLFAKFAGGEGQVKRLLASTGSPLDAVGRSLYERLVRDPAHVDGTLAMMAQWQLDGLIARLPQITTPTLFLTGSDDRAVPPSVSRDAAARMSCATHTDITAAGHLLHEEQPQPTATAIRAFLVAHIT